MQESKNDTTKKKIDYFLLLIAPLKYKNIIIIINVIVFCLVFIVLLFSKILPKEISYLPNIYTSEAKILLPVQNDRELDLSRIGELANPMMFNLERGERTSNVIIGILQTNTVLDGVIENYFLEKKPKIKEEYEKKNITKETLRKIISTNAQFIEDNSTGFIMIRYKDTDPKIAKEMVEAFLEMLNKATHDFALTQTALKKRFIEKRLIEIKEKLDQAKEEYINFQQEYGIISPEHEAEQIINTISALRAELINKESELAEYRRIHKLDKSEKTDLDFEVNGLRRRIIKLTKGSKKKSSANDIFISKNRISELTSEFKNLKRNVENFASLYSSSLNELEITQIQEKSEGTIIQILDPPEVPIKKSEPSRSMILMRIITISIIITIIFPIALEWFKTSILPDAEIRKKLKILVSYLSFREKK